MTSLGQCVLKIDELIKKSDLIEDGNPVRYHLKLIKDKVDKPAPYTKITFGERDENKPHKTILMVGETGTGKTTLINTMINYILGVQIKDKVWFEITDDQSDRTSSQSQTSVITVYGVYAQEALVDLTIIDTPGYGDTHKNVHDQEIANNLSRLSKSESVFHEIDAACLVIKSTQNRLSDRHVYIFDAVQSLFGKDIAENIVLLFTHSTGSHPKNALMAVKEAKIKCAVKKKQPVYFLFNNCQGETFEEECKMIQEESWNLSFRGMAGLFMFLEEIESKTLQMTQNVFKKRKELKENISKIQSCVQVIEKNKKELKQTQEVLEKHKKDVEDNNNFEFEFEVTYKEKVDIDPSVAKEATCCTVCEENCHYPGCWWVRDLSWCSVMKNNHCTVCTNKCHSNKHVKEDKIYETKTKKEKRTNEGLKEKYDDKIRDDESEIKKLEEDLQELEKEKIKLVIEAFHCVECLELIALKTDSLFTLLHIDFLIEKLKEINELKKAEILENMKKRAGEANTGALEYMKKVYRNKETTCVN
ncbi:uncharacterized protein LOC127634937 isoform X1 [Xyrauchen texanus]|uniref:uncharacterized protein LOC127634937 isoform X1 n=1 Tax=Xyrauchen texanus TaxID=154827 RepID=UPI002241D2C7|nr:uncharacterized protein LOC127634937 isoform X1 [Xyrauchen texanus]